MRFALIFFSLLASIVWSAGADAATVQKGKTVNSRKLGLVIRVEGDDWGRVPKAQIETVLYAVADELLSRLPQKLSVPIVVTHTERNPVALYERGPAGEYQVRLHASGERWYVYAYEFAHEFCHILSNYEENLAADRRKENQWFEEALCETASLYTLKSLALTWEAAPPTPQWQRQARLLRDYFDMLVAEKHRRLPPQMRLANWMGGNEKQLRDDPYLRDKNQLVANQLLPLFEDHPEHWDALCYLNLDPDDARNDLRTYLRNWYDNAPLRHKQFIAEVLGLLADDAGQTVASAAPPLTALNEATSANLRPRRP